MRRISSETFVLNGWRARAHINGAAIGGEPDWKRELATLIPLIESPARVIKHDHRSEVGLFTVDGVNYIVKKFLLQGSWVWFQLTSILFPSLGEIAFNNSVQLNGLGLHAPFPLLLLQRVKGGMVFDSWLVYRYIDGVELSNADGRDIVDYVKRMHQKGWVHRDPHPANFIRTPEGVSAIDLIRARPSRSPYLRAYDIVLLEHDLPDAPDIYPINRRSFWYILAKLGHQMLRVYRQVKYALRRMVGLPAQKEE